MLLEGALRTTMCDQAGCETNDEGKPGLLSGAERAALAKYLLSVPYPPSPDRPYTNTLSSVAMEGVTNLFQMIVEGSVGFSGALGRQVTLNPDTGR